MKKQDNKIDILNLDTDKKGTFKNLPLAYKIIAIILIIVLFFIPVFFV